MNRTHVDVVDHEVGVEVGCQRASSHSKNKLYTAHTTSNTTPTPPATAGITISKIHIVGFGEVTSICHAGEDGDRAGQVENSGSSHSE